MNSDQGILYQAHQFHNMLQSNIQQSMSRQGNYYDNAVIESFFATLKCEFIYINEFHNMEQFKNMLEKYIYFYNNYRIKSNCLTPVHERQFNNLVD